MGMAADWEKLSDEWADNEVGLIAEVDCTIESNEPICGGVQGYPTVKYGDPNSLDNCTDEEKTEIAKFDALSLPDLESAIAQVDGSIAQFEQDFEAEVDKLQTRYDELMKGVEEKTAALQKDSGYKYMKSVLAAKKPPAPESDDEEGEL